jgi:hypothetical protein
MLEITSIIGGGILASRARYYQKLLGKVNTKCWAEGTSTYIMLGSRIV